MADDFDRLFQRVPAQQTQPAPAPALNPNQSALVPPAGGPPADVWSRMATGGKPERGADGLWYVGGKVANPAMQKYLNGQTGSGGSGVTVVMPPTQPGTPQEYSVGGNVLFNPTLKMYFTKNPKTGALTVIDPKDVEAAGGKLLSSAATGTPIPEPERVKQAGQHAQEMIQYNYKTQNKNAELVGTFGPRQDALDTAKMLIDTNQTTWIPSDALPLAQLLSRSGLLPPELEGKVQGTRMFQALMAKIKPSLREPGSGEISNRDLEEFGNALPKVGDDPRSAKMIINFFQQSMRRTQTVHDLRDEWLATHNGSLYEFNPDGSVKTSFKQFVKDKGLDGLHQRFTDANKMDKWKPEDWQRFDKVQDGDVLKLGSHYATMVGRDENRYILHDAKGGEFSIPIWRPPEPQPQPQPQPQGPVAPPDWSQVPPEAFRR